MKERAEALLLLPLPWKTEEVEKEAEAVGVEEDWDGKVGATWHVNAVCFSPR